MRENERGALFIICYTIISIIMQAHIFILGKVTGVYFRAFVKERADRVGVKGWVRNRYEFDNEYGSNPRVEAVLQGSKSLLEELIRDLHIGPPFSKVIQVVVKWEEEKQQYSSFEIQ